MSRSLKPYKVDEYWDKLKRARVDLMLDRNTKTFFAEVQLERVEHASLEGLKELVKDKLTSWREVEWRRVIEMEFDSLIGDGEENRRYSYDRTKFGRHRAKLDFTVLRKEIGEAMDGETVERPFAADLDEHDATKQESNPLALSSRVQKYELERQIPYTDELWETLKALEATMGAAAQKLKTMFDPKDGGRRLLALTGVPLLPASTDVVDAAPSKARRR